MTGAPALPGSLRDLLAPGMTVWADSPVLHTEIDPSTFTPRGGCIHTIGADEVGVVLQGVKGWPGGLRFQDVPADAVHACGEEHCMYRPAPTRPADVKFIVCRLYTLLAESKDRDTRIRYNDMATTLLTRVIV